MAIPKKLIGALTSIVLTALPLASDAAIEKLKQEKIYADQKHNGMVKFASIVFALIGLVLTIIAIKQIKLIVGFIGILAVVAYVITFLYCMEIIKEKKRNTYKIVFIIGDMLMVIVATLLLF